MGVKVVVATRGRAAEVATLIEHIGASTRSADRVVIVGTEEADVHDIGPDDLVNGGLSVIIADRLGLSHQRNVGVDALRQEEGWSISDVVVFMDDDFRPAPSWFEEAAAILSEQPEIAGLTGTVLADGVKGPRITEDEAGRLIADWMGQARGADGSRTVDVHGLYGCNMAVRGHVLEQCRFDERLPLYGWLEDLDLSNKARRFGRIVETSRCGGVHLGAKGGRISGRRYGYSQIANPVYLATRRTCPPARAAFMVARALGSNILRSWREHPLFDYRGRLAGNLLALRDLALGRVRPETILDL